MMDSAAGGSRGGGGESKEGGGGGGGGGGDAPPIDAFVVMEDAMAVALVSNVDASLQAIKKVLYGTALLTPAIQGIASALIAGE